MLVRSYKLRTADINIAQRYNSSSLALISYIILISIHQPKNPLLFIFIKPGNGVGDFGHQVTRAFCNTMTRFRNFYQHSGDFSEF